MQNRWWDYGGDCIIRTDQYIRLASDKASRDGWIFSRVPLTATNWEVIIPAMLLYRAPKLTQSDHG